LRLRPSGVPSLSCRSSGVVAAGAYRIKDLRSFDPVGLQFWRVSGDVLVVADKDFGGGGIDDYRARETRADISSSAIGTSAILACSIARTICLVEIAGHSREITHGLRNPSRRA